tara:strand:- start:4810 stop:5883 length:1074 start_codon:yes stop_codon:yes gene_type:complete
MIKEFIKKHQQKISAGALLVGFFWDALTLTRIDYFFEVLVLGTHTSLIVLWILLINIIEGKDLKGWFFGNIRTVAPILMQVSFGALFSALTIFYIKSASFTTTLVFVLILLGLLIGNEFFRKKYQKFAFQFSVLFVALASFFALYIPVLVSAVGAWVFILANVVAAFVIFLLVEFLKLFVPERVNCSRNGLRISIGSIVILLQLLYFSNIIPPVPLALKDKGIYHDVYKSEQTFVGVEEKENFFEKILPGTTIHFEEGESLAMYSAVFAPTGLSTNIAHSWEYFDAESNAWIPQGRISFPISGGRDSGFRGYTQKSNIFEGKWRVQVVTKRDQVLGRVVFTLKKAEKSLNFIEKELN